MNSERQDIVAVEPSARSLVVSIVLDAIRGRWVINDEPHRHSMPARIDDYVFERTITNEGYDRFQYGAYRNASGHRAIAKQWSGKRHNLNYYWLKNEIAVYTEISDLYTRDGSEMTKRFPRIRTPKLIKIVSEPHRLLLVTELAEGVHPSHAEMTNGTALFEELTTYFRCIGSQLRRHRISTIPERNITFILATFPVVVMRALIKHPRLWKEAAQALWLLLSNLPTLLSERQTELIHRDIKPANVFIGDHLVMPIDLELMVFAHPFIDRVHTAIRSLDDPHIEIERALPTNDPDEVDGRLRTMLYRFFGTYAALYEISSISKASQSRAFEFLRYALALKPIQNI